MEGMFAHRNSSEESNTSNFDTSNVNSTKSMFHDCFSLKELNTNNFKINDTTNTKVMFSGCSGKIEDKIIALNKNFKK